MLVLVSRMYEQYEGKDEFFWSAQRLVHEKARHTEAAASFTDIIAGLTDLREATQAEIRVLNQQLVSEAEAAQDAKVARTGGKSLHSLDVTATWGPWRNLLGGDTTAGELFLITEPRLGLGRGHNPAAAA
jgi:hypothetical protein